MKIYALTDSHQEARNLALVLGDIYMKERFSKEPFLLLDCGDLFKGIYDRELTVKMYIKFKEEFPESNIVINLGNNDFGFNKSDFEFLKTTIKKFNNAGITVLCANLKNTKDEKKLVPEFKIIETKNKKIFITGFCINNSCAKNFGYELLDAQTCYKNLTKNIKKNDKIIVLNHHWYPYSKKLKDYSKEIGKEINLIIGGHEHSYIKADYENNIYYPHSFARSYYEMDEDLNSIQEIKIKNQQQTSKFLTPVTKYEKEVKLFSTIAKRKLNLTKSYSEPCPLGTFISDNMKRVGRTDIALHSTGFTMNQLSTENSDIITKYDFERVICAQTTISKIEVTTEELKNIFQNATNNRMYKNNGNSKFLQCSQNITITGKGNLKDLSYKIIQIEIDGEKLLDKNSNPINPFKKFTCTIDDYIGSGEQGFEMLKNINKYPVKNQDNQNIKLNELLLESLKLVQEKYSDKTDYPTFKIIDLY